ncbi:hypothetical protein BDP81DRAFT_110388 [Colletotrichum phormii]|uniref:Uncharacterized protein n=1 Tax=Colletotrichum phormii TaxID=359342 RepID=A0AAI9ZH71_9PEZI|nr:uncharacterized protein BDP81DRAFT_110388 [Colletotrichum phormii]KAK1624533.1 hypothetical protein BDP81DRAFT_110388 [Colletotrichum phormii]
MSSESKSYVVDLIGDGQAATLDRLQEEKMEVWCRGPRVYPPPPRSHSHIPSVAVPVFAPRFTEVLDGLGLWCGWVETRRCCQLLWRRPMEASGTESTFPDLAGVGESPLPRSATGTACSTFRHRLWELRATFPRRTILPPPPPSLYADSSQLGDCHPVSLSIL